MAAAASLEKGFAITFDEEPTFAARALDEAFDLPRVPVPLKVLRTRAAPVTRREFVVLAAPIDSRRGRGRLPQISTSGTRSPRPTWGRHRRRARNAPGLAAGRAGNVQPADAPPVMSARTCRWRAMNGSLRA